jgi:hypothetical protein
VLIISGGLPELHLGRGSAHEMLTLNFARKRARSEEGAVRNGIALNLTTSSLEHSKTSSKGGGFALLDSPPNSFGRLSAITLLNYSLQQTSDRMHLLRTPCLSKDMYRLA